MDFFFLFLSFKKCNHAWPSTHGPLGKVEDLFLHIYIYFFNVTSAALASVVGFAGWVF